MNKQDQSEPRRDPPLPPPYPDYSQFADLERERERGGVHAGKKLAPW